MATTLHEISLTLIAKKEMMRVTTVFSLNEDKP